jgi:ribosomal protein L44E
VVSVDHMTDLETRLLNYLRRKADRPALDYGDFPKPMLGGFDATVMRFSLRDASDSLSGPLASGMRNAGSDLLRDV